MNNKEYLQKIILSALNLYGAMKKDRLLSLVNYYISDFVYKEELDEAVDLLLELRGREFFIYDNDILANFLFYYDDLEELEEVLEKVRRIVFSHDFNKQYLPSLDELLNYYDPSYVSNKEDLENLANYIFDNNISPHSESDTVLIIYNIAFSFKEGINVSINDLIEEENFNFKTKKEEEDVHELLGTIKESTRLYILFGGTILENGDDFVNNIDEYILDKKG